MTTPADVFASGTHFRIRRIDGGQEYDAVQVGERLRAVLPDRPHFEDVERVLEEKETSFDPVTGKKTVKVKVRKVQDKAKCFTFTEAADSDAHGGNISLWPGDYLVKDGDSFFVVPDIDRASRKPVFSERFVRI